MNNSKAKNLLLLLFGAFFLFFSNGRFSFALAPWLYPVFILQVSRKEKTIYSWLFIPLLTGICSQLSFWKFTYDNSSNILFYLPALLGLMMGLLFFIDRLLYPKVRGFAATLIFPLLYTSFDFLLNLFNPFGTLGVLGYSQVDFLSFSQLASVTGMWGLTFMITWFGSVVCWALENIPDKIIIKRGITIYFSILISIITFGSIRLNVPLSNGTVKIAGIHTHDKRIEGNKMTDWLYKKDTAAFKKISDGILQDLIQATIKESNAGAKIVVWSEICSKILKRDEDSFINVFKTLARQQEIYLVTAPYTLSPDSSPAYLPDATANKTYHHPVLVASKPENKILLFSPVGDLALTHFKYGGNFMEGTVEGDKVIKTITTEHGKISAIICWDGDFPSVVKQAGKLETDILFVPASDWEELVPAHAVVTIFRGIENGCSVVRQTRNGLSVMTGPRGELIAKMDHFKSNSWVMVGQVPTKKLFTLYPIIGDLFGWLSLLGLLFFITRPIFNKNTAASISNSKKKKTITTL